MMTASAKPSRRGPVDQADQAQGLRKLFRQPGVRVLPLFGARERVAASVNLAAALMAVGSRPIIVDAGRGEIADALGLAVRYELRHLLQGEKNFDEVALLASCGARVLPAQRGIDMLVGSTNRGAGNGDALFGAFANIADPADIVLLNAPDAIAAATLPSVTGEVLVVVTPSADALTTAYSNIKTLAATHGVARFRTLVMKADAGAAQDIHARIAMLARERLGVDVQPGGFIPDGLHLRQAEIARRTVIETEPNCAAAMAFRRLATELAGWDMATTAVADVPATQH